MFSAWMRIAGAVFVLHACSMDSPAPKADDAEPGEKTASLPPRTIQLVDSTISPAIAGQEGWHYQQSADVDLT